MRLFAQLNWLRNNRDRDELICDLMSLNETETSNEADFNVLSVIYRQIDR